MVRFIVQHCTKKRQFFVDLENNARALLDYKIDPKARIIDMYHTETPPQYQRQGIARIIVEAALDYAQKEQLKVRATCSYVAHYLRKTDNDAYKTLRLNDSRI